MINGCIPVQTGQMEIQRNPVAPPYSLLAQTYDATLGLPFFMHMRSAFEALVRRYGIGFRSAADLGCGTGMFACYLSRTWGIPVFAVDRSPEMLRVAAGKCPDARVCFLRQDIRWLRLPRPVDLITANFDTLNHLVSRADLRRAFRRIAANLKAGGHFLFDLVTHRQPCPGPCRFLRRFRVGRREVQQRVRWDPRHSLISIVVVHRMPRAAAPAMELHWERGYAPVRVIKWLRDAGFGIRGIHDAATLRMAIVCPPRIIVVARKACRDKLGEPPCTF